MIACANYSEFWIRYVEFVEAKGGRELANHALTRAVTVFLKVSPKTHTHMICLDRLVLHFSKKLFGQTCITFHRKVVIFLAPFICCDGIYKDIQAVYICYHLSSCIRNLLHNSTMFFLLNFLGILLLTGI